MRARDKVNVLRSVLSFGDIFVEIVCNLTVASSAERPSVQGSAATMTSQLGQCENTPLNDPDRKNQIELCHAIAY